MRKILDAKQEPAERGIFKWIVGVLLLGGIIGGCFLIYRWRTKPSPEQVQQNKEHKEILNKQIQEIKKKADNNRNSLKKAKNGEENFKWDVFDEKPKSPPFDPSDKELVELEKKKWEIWNGEYNETLEEGNKWLDKIGNQEKSLWERQRNGQWKILTDRLDKSLDTKTHFDKFIRTFYQRFGEKKGIKIHEPRIDFYGFGHFYVKDDEELSSHTEMGHTATTDPDGKEIQLTSTGGGPFEITYFPMMINLNQIYLLNHGTIGMDKFYREAPSPTNGGFPIDFDKLTETIAHEIAHALQNIKNIDNRRKSAYEPGKPIFSQCESSGERKGGNLEEELLHPDWAAEHTKLTKEIEQMIKSSSEYQEFKKWWQNSA